MTEINPAEVVDVNLLYHAAREVELKLQNLQLFTTPKETFVEKFEKALNSLTKVLLYHKEQVHTHL